MTFFAFEGIVPIVDPTAFVHPSASIIGDVQIGPGCLVGPCASLRGDIGRITMERGSNVQDGCTVHTFPGKACCIGEDAHVGHGAVLHGCHLRHNAMVGMNAVLMDDVIIGRNSVVAAMAFVKSGTEVPPDTLIAGIPARVVRELTKDEIAWKTAGTVVYQRLADRYRATFREVDPLPAPPRDRPCVPEIDYHPKSG